MAKYEVRYRGGQLEGTFDTLAEAEAYIEALPNSSKPYYMIIEVNNEA